MGRARESESESRRSAAVVFSADVFPARDSPFGDSQTSPKREREREREKERERERSFSAYTSDASYMDEFP